MARALTLERFIPPGHGAAEAASAHAQNAARKAAWDEGHAAGLRAGTEAAAQAHAEDQSRLRMGLVEALGDQKQAQVEAQKHVMQDLAPFVCCLVSHLAPRLAAAALADHVAEALTAALQARPDPVPVVRCSPEAVDALDGALLDWGGLKLTTDPALTPLEAEVHWDNGFDAINVAAVLNHIDDSLAALGVPPTATGAPAAPPASSQQPAQKDLADAG